VPTLLDRPSEQGLVLIRTIANGYGLASGVWPNWQWVKYRLWREGLDAEEILRGLPSWKHGYRAVRAGGLGQVPGDGDPVSLTVYGMAHAVDPATDRLLAGFLESVRLAAVLERSIQPSPNEVVERKEDAVSFTTAVNRQAGTELSMEQLFGALRGEPATWIGITMNNGTWTWDLTNARLAPFADVRDIQDYLARLDELVALPGAPVQPVAPSPMALAEAFDHLDLAWLLVTHEHLVCVPRVAMAARLAQPAASAEEFESRCSALADLLSYLNVPGQDGEKGKTLQNLKARLGELLGDRATRAQDAIDILRHVVALRAGQQHSGTSAAKGARKAVNALGLTSLTAIGRPPGTTCEP
jgi:hypothetical protein